MRRVDDATALSCDLLNEFDLVASRCPGHAAWRHCEGKKRGIALGVLHCCQWGPFWAAAREGQRDFVGGVVVPKRIESISEKLSLAVNLGVRTIRWSEADCWKTRFGEVGGELEQFRLATIKFKTFIVEAGHRQLSRPHMCARQSVDSFTATTIASRGKRGLAEGAQRQNHRARWWLMLPIPRLVASVNLPLITLPCCFE